jgi:transposase
MRQRDDRAPGSAEKTVRDIRRATRRQFSAEEKIRIVLEGLRERRSLSTRTVQAARDACHRLPPEP